MMGLTDEERRQVDDAWLETLLHAAYHHGQAIDDRRMSQLVGSLDASETQQTSDCFGESDQVVAGDFNWSSAPQSWQQNSLLRYSVLAVSVLLLVSVWYAFGAKNGGTPNSFPSARQVLNQILNTPLKDRTYDLILVNRLPESKQRVIRAKLYLDDLDQFAVELPSLLGVGTCWIGGNPRERWVVPPIGPAMVGGEGIVGSWLNKKDVASPYLHLNTIVMRMGRAFDLQTLPNEASPSETVGRGVPCRRLLGTRREGDATIPASIELWAEASSGILHQVVLQWDRSQSERGPLLWTIRLSANAPLSKGIFDPESHTHTNQTLLQIKSEEQLSELDASF